MGPIKDASSTNAMQATVTFSYGPMNVVNRDHQLCPLPGAATSDPLWALGMLLEMAAGVEAQRTMEGKQCVTVTRQRSHGQCRKMVPTRAGCSTRVGNRGSSSVASSSGLTKMYLHQVLLPVDTTTVDLTVAKAAATDLEMGERKRETPVVTELLLLRNHVTAVFVTCPDTPESPVHSGDARATHF